MRQVSNRSLGFKWRCGGALLLGVLLLTGCGGLHRRVPDTDATVQIKPYKAPDAHAAQVYQVLLGEIAGQRGKIPESVQNYLLAAQSSTDPRVAQRAMQIALYARDDSSAQQAAERWLTLEPDNLEPRQALSMLYLRSGRIDESVAQFDHLITKYRQRQRRSVVCADRHAAQSRDRQGGGAQGDAGSGGQA